MNIVVIHSATINNYTQILDEMLGIISSSGLARSEVIVSLTGTGLYDGARCMRLSDSIDEWEFPTIRFIQKLVERDDHNILYMHTLGLTQPGLQPKIDARRYMMHFLVGKHQECISALDSGEFNCAGVDWRTDPAPHFSCNFWWAKGRYLRTLPTIDHAVANYLPPVATVRHRSEFWIGLGEAKPKILWDCGIHQYERHMHNYPRERYA